MEQIIRADAADHYGQARSLIREYAESLGFDLEFQHFEQEMARFPSDYQPPSGCLFLAAEKDEAVGCVAVRRLREGVCEMKRLYLKPASRGHGLGRKLAEAAVKAAGSLGYKRMRLDTLATMAEANTLYRSMGFEPIEPYRYNPIPGANFMELALE